MSIVNKIQSNALMLFKEGPYLDLVRTHQQYLDHFYTQLQDEVSRTIFEWYFTTRILGELIGNQAKAVQLYPAIHAPAKWNEYVAQAQAFDSSGMSRFNPDEYIESRLLGGYTIDGIVMPSEGDIIFDLGVFNGNNALIFSAMVGNTGSVYGFEPHPVFYQESLATIQHFGATNIQLVNQGCSDQPGTLHFDGSRGMASRFSDSGDYEVALTTVDEFVTKNNITRLDFIKIDIEGSEQQALKGATQTITQYRPILCIAMYHKVNDFVEIPRLIDPIGIWYKYYLRHYHRMPRETVLYAVPVEQHIPDWCKT